MTEFKIIDDIEMPEPNGRGRPCKYPWGLLEVGQGFEVPASGEKYKSGIDKVESHLRGSGSYWAKRSNSTAKFQTVKVGDVIRVKRIA